MPFLIKVLCDINLGHIWKEKKAIFLRLQKKKDRLALYFTLILEVDFVDKDRLELNINLNSLNILCFTEIPT